MSGASSAVALALPGDACEPALLDAIESAAGFDVVRRCLDISDLVALAQAGRIDLAIIGGRMLQWDRDTIARLHACDVGVVGVVATSEGAAHLRSLGVEPVLVRATPADVAAATDELIDSLSSAGPTATSRRGDDRTSRGYAHGRSSATVAMDRDAPASTDALTGPIADDDNIEPDVGSMIGVWGPTGAPGRTTVALGLAACLARSGLDVLLIDADPYGGTVDQYLGVLDDEVPGVAAACRLAHHGRLDAASLVPLARAVALNLAVLTGLPRADRWPELRPASLTTLWSVARRVADVVVVDAGFCLEEDEELSYDTLAPRRNAATVSALAAADTVIAVGGADPIGLRRLVRGLDELDRVVDGAPPVVVVNRGTGKGRQAAVRREVEAVLEATGRDLAVHVVPDDLDTCRRATREGRTLVEAAPGSPIVKALADLAGMVHPGPAAAVDDRSPAAAVDDRSPAAVTDAERGSALGRLRRLVG